MENNQNFKLYPLTNPQKRIWYVENIYEKTVMYNIGGYLKIKGTIDFNLLEESVNILIKENDGLRLRFVEKNGTLLQYVKNFEKVTIQRIDFSICDTPENSFYIWTKEEMEKSISLKSDNLYFFAFFKKDHNESGLFLKMHHIISDGWSFSLIAKQICDIYTKLANGQDISNYKPPSYVDFIDSEQHYLNSSRFLKNRAFWLEKFTTLPEKSAIKSIDSLEGHRNTYQINDSRSKQIKNFTSNYGISLNTFFTAMLLIYMNKIFHKDDIILGIPVLNRTSKKERQMIGMFTSTMPFRYKLNGDLSAENFIKDINSALLSSFFHQRYPYNLLVQDLKLSKKGYDSLFEVCVNYYNTSINNKINGMSIENVELYSGEQLYSLQLIIKEFLETDTLSLSFDYKTNVYSHEQIDDLYGYLNNIIDKILDNPKEKLSKINLLSSKERENLQFKLNSTETKYPKEKTIYELFEEQVEIVPNNIALSFNNETLSYKQLNEKANQLARKLRKKGVGKDKIVGFMTTHSLDTVIGILAILKSGGAYVPIDPEYPTERIRYIIEDSAVSLVLTNREINESIFLNQEIINLKDSNLYSGNCDNLEKINTPKDLAYVIYTSGSTGKPKGVMVEHGGLVNYIWWARKNYIKSKDEIFALYSSLSFDLTVTSIFTPLIGGNRLNIYYDDGSEFILYKILRENKVNIIKLTPAHLSLLKDMDNSNSSVSRFIVGGDDLKTSLAVSICKSFGNKIEIFNEYGPTETVVGCMIHKFDINKDKGLSVPIGIPADNVQIYILDKDLNIVPPETIGELYISGDGVARGYLNQAELTKSRFIQNPFVIGKRLYKTGDSAKYKKDGKIEYIGRIDRQVKIRGHRIELGEIEKHLTSIEEVLDAIVVDHENENGEKNLYGYVVLTNELPSIEIKKFLSKFLPNYMIPIHFIPLDTMPLTQNGKININQLPKPESIKSEKAEFITYQNETEKKLIEVTQEVLNIEKIGLLDGFYELGGDSIKAIQISSRLNNIGLNIKVKDILSHDTMQEIAACIETLQGTELEEQSVCEGIIEPTPISSWFFKQRFKNKNHWNQSVLLEISEYISNTEIIQAINKLIHHHDTLRLNYNSKIGKLYYNEKHLEDLKDIEEFNLTQLSKAEQISAINQLGEAFKGNFDLEKDLLFKGCIFDLGTSKRLLLTAHHLIIDGVSWRILLEDLNDLILQNKKDIPTALPLKTSSFQKWAMELEKYSKEEFVKQEIEYWDSVIENKAVYPVTFDLGEDKLKFSSTLKAVLNTEETEALITKANKAYGTDSNELLIIALAFTASRFSKQKTVTFEIEGHGREEITNAINISRSVGWFTSIYPVNLKINQIDLNSKIKELKEQLRSVPSKGINYGILKYLSKSIKQDESKLIRFNYLGDFDSTLKDSLFKFAKEDSGSDFDKENHLPYLIEIVAIHIDGKLNISITYSKNKFSDEAMQSFMKEYLNQIKDVIDYCINKEYSEFTPSDFDAAELSQEDLDSLFD
ncbi:hypothetical protein CSC2_28750 [Clostridium zeae]|uniref:Carrier domain-containing protein n=1 Tax=Clostridium zeae TaxID=2759022 RepID=A0ABQ1EC86_9CLOT|nr:non-ribosomal peptide synthetase [Clostridium zeae]GFZ32349.1 hypothetical protein CSC2_28750 [Clostridium zeae]